MQELKTQSITKGKIAEIFYSIQGEGIYTGLPQVFVRFYGCNLSCKFCDTKLTQFNKYSVLKLFEILSEFKDKFHSVCFTGGEPLLQKDFLKEALVLIKQKGITTYLETNGTLPAELSEVIDYIDIIAMDWKLSSSTGLKDFDRQHIAFLKIASEKDVFIKMVICDSTEVSDLEKATELIIKVNREIPLVLQPNYFELVNNEKSFLNADFRELPRPFVKLMAGSRLNVNREAGHADGRRLNLRVSALPACSPRLEPSAKPGQRGRDLRVSALINKLKIYQNICLKYLNDVRIMPQMHKTLNIK
ncbi:MAG: 7-carboxy-7-deazaguanine synthase QueE [Candidatus Omnitrophica bacterium]|nr:7-carboxy-7-deazaguanine synthase QueE [Candidatus Omnitrophota bacterium]